MVDPRVRVVTVLNMFDYVFAENGLDAYKGGKPLAKQVCCRARVRAVDVGVGSPHTTVR